MAVSQTDILTTEELSVILALPEVLAAKERLDAQHGLRGLVQFFIELPTEIKQRLSSRLGIDLSAVAKIPMRWIRGDTLPHVDRGASEFTNTYLMQLNDSAGEFVVNGEVQPIEANTAYVFSEGTSHETVLTGQTPRLLLGPMNEFAQPVGSAPITQFSSLADALSFNNAIGQNTTIGNYTVGNVETGTTGGQTSWRIASTSSGTSSQLLTQNNGDNLNADGNAAQYYLYPNIICFKEGTQVLCKKDHKECQIPVEKLEKGTLVKTLRDGYKPVELLGKGTIENPGTDERTENRLQKLSCEKYPELTKDLYLTGCHSVLVDTLTETQKEGVLKTLSRFFVTDKKYRLPAVVDERAEPWNSEGTYNIYHFALEHADEGMNQGIQVNGGLLVETCSLRALKKRSNFTFY